MGVFADLDSPISLAFLAAAASGGRGGLARRRGGVLQEPALQEPQTPAQLLGRLRSAPDGRAGELEEAQAPSERGRALSSERVLTIIGAKPTAPGEEEAPSPADKAPARAEVAAC